MPDPLGKARALLADTGYFSAANAEGCDKAEIEPVIAENPTPVATMAHRLKVPEGRTLHALRKQTPEPVFGIIKTVPGCVNFTCAASTGRAANGAA